LRARPLKLPAPLKPRVLITGSAKRIGRSIAIELAKRGFDVAIHYGKSEKEAREVSELCGGAPVFQANLESVDEIRRMFAEIREGWGSLDCLVNNAARFTRLDPLDVTEADWDFIHSVNLKATFFCCQEGARMMKERGAGRIVNISSLGGIRPWAEHVHYCASKAGVIMMTRALSKALAPEITVNSVAPGVISFNDVDARTQQMIDNTPMLRSGSADEIAEAVHFFLTAPTFITGQILAVDGGLSQR
jgi:NAD(P)-dependent dehydrogenase (short-subunit alcohol dehydrogenase family)